MLVVRGEEVRRRRRELGLSIYAVRALAGIDAGMLSRWERGQYEPSAAMQREVKLALHSVDVLIKTFPLKIDLKNTSALKQALDDLYAGRFKSYARLKDEEGQTRREIIKKGEAAAAAV